MSGISEWGCLWKALLVTANGKGQDCHITGTDVTLPSEPITFMRVLRLVDPAHKVTSELAEMKLGMLCGSVYYDTVSVISRVPVPIPWSAE